MQGREPSLWSPGRRIIDGDFLVRCHRRGRWDRRFQSGWNTRQGRARCSGDGYARRRVQCFAVIRAADRWLTDTRNADAAAAVLVKHTNTREEYARRSYDLYYREAKSMPEGAEVSDGGMTNLLQIMAEQGRLEAPLPSVERFVDLGYRRAAAGE